MKLLKESGTLDLLKVMQSYVLDIDHRQSVEVIAVMDINRILQQMKLKGYTFFNQQNFKASECDSLIDLVAGGQAVNF
jgi:hypothetical protein